MILISKKARLERIPKYCRKLKLKYTNKIQKDKRNDKWNQVYFILKRF